MGSGVFFKLLKLRIKNHYFVLIDYTMIFIIFIKLQPKHPEYSVERSWLNGDPNEFSKNNTLGH